MFGSNLAKTILNCLVNQGSSDGITTNVKIDISTSYAKLALFTTMPGSDGTGAKEVSLAGYARKPLYGDGVSGVKQFSTATAWDSTEQKYIIKNTDEIQMHAIAEDATGSEKVYGFGIYGGSGPSLLAWGKLVDSAGNDTDVTLSAGSVPIFYKGQFKLMLGEEAS